MRLCSVLLFGAGVLAQGLPAQAQCSASGSAVCVLNPPSGPSASVPVGAVDSTYIQCSNGRFAIAGLQSVAGSNAGARTVAYADLGTTGALSVVGPPSPAVSYTPPANPVLPSALASTHTALMLLAGHGPDMTSGAPPAVELRSAALSASPAALSFAPVGLFAPPPLSLQGDVDCNPADDCLSVYSSAPPNAGGTTPGPEATSYTFLRSDAVLHALSTVWFTAAGSPVSPLYLGRPATSWDAATARFWMASYRSPAGYDVSLTTLDPSAPSTLGGTATVSTSVATSSGATQGTRRLALAPDGLGGIVFVADTLDPSGTSSALYVGRCTLVAGMPSCRQDNSWLTAFATTGLHNPRLPTLAYDGRRVLLAFEAVTSASVSQVGVLTLDTLTTLWSVMGNAATRPGGSPSLASDRRGGWLLSYAQSGSVVVQGGRLGCTGGLGCPTGSVCTRVGAGSEMACYTTVPECGSAVEAGPEATLEAGPEATLEAGPEPVLDAGIDGANTGDGAALADVTAGDLGPESGADADGATEAAQGDSGTMLADGANAETSANADGAGSDMASRVDGAAAADSGMHSLTGGSCQCAAPGGAGGSGPGSVLGLAVAGLGLVLSRRRRS